MMKMVGEGRGDFFFFLQSNENLNTKSLQHVFFFFFKSRPLLGSFVPFFCLSFFTDSVQRR